MKYLPVSVLSTKSDGMAGNDSTNGGVSSTHYDKLCVPVEDGYLTLDDVTERGYIILELQKPAIAGAPGQFVPKGESAWTMFGGNYITTSDSRFRKAYGWSPIAIHDRVEGTRTLVLKGTAIKSDQEELPSEKLFNEIHNAFF